MLRKVALGVLLLMVLLLGLRYLFGDDINAAVINELRTNPAGERASISMLVTLDDGRIYPVNFLRENGLVFMGIDGFWWREFQGDGADVRLLIQGDELTGRARVVLDNPSFVDDVFSRLRPTVPGWLPDWLNGKLVVITPHE